MTTAKHDATGWFVLDRISGTLPPELREHALARQGRDWLPFAPDAARTLLVLPGARLDARAIRCATRLELDLTPPPATLALVLGPNGPRFGLDVNWDPDPLAAFLALPEADRTGRAVPIDPFLLEPLERLLHSFDVEVGHDAREALERIRREHDEAIEDVRRSRATTAPPIAAASRLGGELRPFQHAGVRYLLRARRCFLADEQGLGKTVEALAALEEDGAFPAIVVCPASLKLNWERETKKWLPQRSVTVVDSAKPAFPRADITIINYELLAKQFQRLGLIRAKALVLDEAHYCKNPRARRTQAARRLAEALPPDALRLALSGTPVLNRPDELISQLRIIGRLREFGSGAQFKATFRGMGAEQRLHWHLRRSCFTRRLKADVLPQLPAKRRVVVPVELTNVEEYQRAEEDFVAWLREQPLELDDLEAKIASTLRAERLAQITALKRLAALGKLAAATDWIADFLASGERLVVFAHHRDVLAALLQRFPDAAHLLGSDSLAAREAAVRAFQSGGAQLFVGSLRVAAQGITLTRASNVCFLELDWTPAMHDQAEDRVHRIGQHDAVVAWYLLAARTIDEMIAELLERKRGLIGAVTDGRADDSASLVDSIVREIRSAG